MDNFTQSTRRQLLIGSLTTLAGIGLAACGAATPPTAAGSATSVGTTASAAPTQAASTAAVSTAVSSPASTTAATTVRSATTTTAASASAIPTPSPAASVSAAKLTVQVWNADWGTIFNDDMAKIGDSYTQAHPEVAIEWKWMSDSQKELTVAIAGDVPPDANYTNWVFLPEMASQGAQLQLDTYLQQSGIKGEDFIPATWAAVEYKGHTYAMPGGSDWIVLFWNGDAFTKAGLDPQKPPITLQDLEDFSNKLYKTDSSGNYVTMGMPPGMFGLATNAFLMGGGFYDEKSGKLTANSPENIKALEWEVSLAKRWNLDKVKAFTKNMPSYSKAGSGFTTDKQAFLTTGFWAYEPLDKFAADLKYGIAYMPTPTGAPEERSRYLIQGWDYGIPKGAKHPADAWNFIKYAFYDQAALMGSETLNGPCVLKTFPDFTAQVKKMIGANNRMSPYLDIFTSTASAGSKYWPVLPMSSQYYKAVGQAESDALAGKGAPRDLLDGVQSAMTTLMQQQGKS